MAQVTKDLGIATAYGYALSKGYTGTEEEYAVLMASYGTVAEEAGQSAENAENSAEISEAWAVGTKDGTAVTEDDPEYNNNAKYYAEQAGTLAGNASDYAEDAEAWAVGERGGVPVGSTDETYHNNSKYYAQSISGAAAQISANTQAISDEVTNRQNADTALSNQIAALQSAVGSPLQAATVSGMTDHDKIYVYTGSETGYTAGNWYYWDGSAWVSGGVYNAVAVTTDTTLSIAGEPADAKVTGDNLTDLKSQIQSIEEVTVTVTETPTTTTENIYDTIEWSDYYMNLKGLIGSNSDYRHSQKIAVSEGDIIAFANSNFTFTYITAFNGDSAVEASGTSNVNSYTVPSGIDGVVLSEYDSRGSAAINHTKTVITVTYSNTLDPEIDAISAELESIENVITVENYTDEVTTSVTPTFTTGAMDQNGTVYTSSTYQSYQYSQKIPVTEGDVVQALHSNGAKSMRWVCAFTGNTVVSAKGSNTDIQSYTVPEGIDGIVVTTRISDAVDTIRIVSEVEKTSAYVKPNKMGYMSAVGSLSDGQSITLPIHNVKNDNCYIFNANITAFSAIVFEKGSGAKATVNDTNIVIENDSTTITIPHGLTIGNNITLLIENGTSTNLSLLRLSSDGFVFDYTTATRFVMDSGAPKVTSSGSTLTECRLSWVSKNVNAPIWVFGDSYLSWYPERWTYYAAQDGFTKDVLFNGFAGQASASAYASLVNLLAITIPKMIVWCLGMNDPDDGVVNASWYLYYQKIIELQKKYGFELVLYTVPTTPIMDNSYKDAIIRSSGYRYIEADFAVTIDNEGHWVGYGTENPALDVDNVHPTAIGAKILYCRILADLPEMMCNY